MRRLQRGGKRQHWRGHAKPTVREIQVELREWDRETNRNEDSSCWCTIFDFKCKFFLNVMPTKVQLTKCKIDWQAKEKKLWKKAQLNNSYKNCYSQLERRERERESVVQWFENELTSQQIDSWFENHFKVENLKKPLVYFYDIWTAKLGLKPNFSISQTSAKSLLIFANYCRNNFTKLASKNFLTSIHHINKKCLK